jgi:hypothetical protein
MLSIGATSLMSGLRSIRCRIGGREVSRATVAPAERYAEPESEIVRSHEMFGRYRQLVEELSNGSIVGSDWFEELQAIVLQLDLESCDLTVASSKFLYEELCEQFEQEAYLTDNEQRRKVLLAATKLLELQRSVS